MERRGDGQGALGRGATLAGTALTPDEQYFPIADFDGTWRKELAAGNGADCVLVQPSTFSTSARRSWRSQGSASLLAASRTSTAFSRTRPPLFFPSGRALASTLQAESTSSACPTRFRERFRPCTCSRDRADTPAPPRSMMPDHFSLIDRIERFLSPDGLLSVCDFYVSGREKTSLSEVIGDVASRHCGWLTRLFWMTWCALSTLPRLDGSLPEAHRRFEFDHVDLHPSRR